MLDAVDRIQRAYPRIFHACHVVHVRRRSTPYRLSARDGGLLAHLHADRAVSAGELARHLGVARSTLSEAVARLERLGYVTRAKDARDRREVRLWLAELGVAALRATSVLDAERLERVIAHLAPADLERAVAGLELLASAAQESSEQQHKRTRGRSTRGPALPGTERRRKQ